MIVFQLPRAVHPISVFYYFSDALRLTECTFLLQKETDLKPFGLFLQTSRLRKETSRLRKVVRSMLVVKWAVELFDLNPKIQLTLQLFVYFFPFL